MGGNIFFCRDSPKRDKDFFAKVLITKDSSNTQSVCAEFGKIYVYSYMVVRPLCHIVYIEFEVFKYNGSFYFVLLTKTLVISRRILIIMLMHMLKNIPY